MVITRGALCRVDLGPAKGSAPAKRRPVLVVQSDEFTKSTLGTVLVAVVTSNTRLAMMPGNVFMPASATGLAKDSVVNVTALATVDKSDLASPVGWVPSHLLHEVDRGLRIVLGL